MFCKCCASFFLGISCTISLAQVRMCDGRTGRMLDAAVGFGVTFYQRLKHFAMGKAKLRSRGARVAITRQPTETGLRVGEMEVDVLKAHGGVSTLLGRIRDAADDHEARVCRECGTLCDTHRGEPRCRLCGSTDIAMIHTTYCSELLTRELRAMGINLKWNI